MTTAAMPAQRVTSDPRGNSIIVRAMAAVVAADLSTKALAASLLVNRQLPLGGPFRLALLYNNSYATIPLLHVAAIERTAVVVFVLAWVTLRMGSALRKVDPVAPLTLGLLLGAGVANLADMLYGRAGVVDFIAFDHGDVTTVFNVADVAVGLGLLLCVRTASRLWVSALRERRAVHAPPRRIPREVELPRIVYVDAPRQRANDSPIPGPRRLPESGDEPPTLRA
jgi:lipoprotein signal peptidase